MKLATLQPWLPSSISAFLVRHQKDRARKWIHEARGIAGLLKNGQPSEDHDWRGDCDNFGPTCHGDSQDSFSPQETQIPPLNLKSILINLWPLQIRIARNLSTSTSNWKCDSHLRMSTKGTELTPSPRVRNSLLPSCNLQCRFDRSQLKNFSHLNNFAHLPQS